MAIFLWFLAGFIFVGGAIIFGASKKGEQQTLGGIVAAIALLIAALGALARVAGFAILFAVNDPVAAHDHSRPELAPWFNSLKSNAGALCCSNNDGTVLEDADWRSKNGGYEVYLEGEWRRVPEGAVVTEPNKSGRTMVWPLKGYMGLTIRCFMPGPMT